MWYEIIRWISMVLMWAALALNVYGCFLNYRTDKKLRAVLKKYCEALDSLTNHEE